MTKPTWVFVAGPPRSGSSTQYDMTRTVIEDNNKGIGIGYHTEEKLIEWDKTGHDMIVCKVFAFLPEYYYDTHDGMRKRESYGKRIFDEGRLKAVCTVRDPVDMIASMKWRAFKRNDNKFNFKEELNKLPVWLGDVTKWIDLGPDITYWSKFEEYTTLLPREVSSIARHLGVDLSDDEHHRIGNLFTIEAIERRRGKQHNQPPPDEINWKNRHLPSVPSILFGIPGAGKTHLSWPQRKAIREISAEFIERFGY